MDNQTKQELEKYYETIKMVNVDLNRYLTDTKQNGGRGLSRSGGAILRRYFLNTTKTLQLLESTLGKSRTKKSKSKPRFVSNLEKVQKLPDVTEEKPKVTSTNVTDPTPQVSVEDQHNTFYTEYGVRKDKKASLALYRELEDEKRKLAYYAIASYKDWTKQKEKGKFIVPAHEYLEQEIYLQDEILKLTAINLKAANPPLYEQLKSFFEEEKEQDDKEDETSETDKTGLEDFVKENT